MNWSLQSSFRSAGGLLLVFLLALVVAPARASEGDTVLKYFHGAAHVGSVASEEDYHVTDFLGEYIDEVQVAEMVPFGLATWGLKPGDPREEEITKAIVDNLEESPAKFFLVGYSGGAGTLADVMAVRHLNQKAQNDRDLILEGLKKTEAMFILVDPYMGGIPGISPPAPLTEEQKKNITAFLSEGAATAVVILHDNDQERKKSNILDPVVEKAVERLKPLSGERFHVVALEDFNHANIVDDPEKQSKEGLTAIATVTNHYYLELHPEDKTTGERLESLQALTFEHPEWELWQEQWWVWKGINGEGWDLDPVPPRNHPPEVISGALNGCLTVYLCLDGIGGKKAVLLGSVSITDPDGDALTIRLQSQPHYGLVNPTISGSSLYGTYQFFASKEDLIRPCCNHDDLVDHFSVTVSDGHSGEVSIPGTVTIHVVDATLPDVITKNITVDLDENGQASITPQEIDNGSTDNCGIATMILDKDTFTCADLGANTVTLTVTDTSSNSASGQATITVADNIPPILTVPPNVTIECGESTDPSHTGQASAADNCDPNPQITHSDSTSGSCPTLITRTWTATDAYGNFTSDTQQITVEDTTPPTVNCPGDITVETHDPSGTTVTFTVTATDNCDPHPSVTCTPTSGSHFAVGTTTVTCKATDACNNKSTHCHFTITVNFVNHPPVAYGGSYMAFCFGAATHITLQAKDPDGDPLTYIIVTGPQHGFLQGTPPNLLYFANGPGDCCGCPDSFTFKATDGKLDSNVATISIFIDP